MAHSIQKVEDRVGVFNDLDLIALIGLFLEHVQREPAKFPNVSAVVKNWVDELTTYGPGSIDLRIERFIHSEASVKEFQHLLEDVTRGIKRAGPVIPASLLNKECGASGVQFSDFPVEPLLRALEQLQALVP